MSGDNSLILDTNVVIEIFKGNKKVKELFEQDYNLFIPATVIGELYYGCYNSKNPKKHFNQINEFITELNILNTNEEVCISYGKIKTSLKKKGTPIPENDIWIAAFSKANNILLFSFDSHFDFIPDFKYLKSL
ncbi:MAG: type II toxin-antitoxin system VapC family toxin [Chitinophagales bacterium]|nr:type II toxin-antitoxin system VapC family toxin [Chitinophagales bacterium]